MVVVGGIIVLFTVVSFLISEFHILNNLKIVRVVKILMLLTVMVHIVILDKFFDDNDDKLGIIIDNQVKSLFWAFLWR